MLNTSAEKHTQKTAMELATCCTAAHSRRTKEFIQSTNGHAQKCMYMYMHMHAYLANNYPPKQPISELCIQAQTHVHLYMYMHVACMYNYHTSACQGWLGHVIGRQ